MVVDRVESGVPTADRFLAWHLLRWLADRGVEWARASDGAPPVAGDRLPWSDLTELWGRALKAVDDPDDLPLGVARHIGDGHHVSPITLHLHAAGTLADGIAVMVEHWALVTDATAWSWHRHPGGPALCAPVAQTDSGARALYTFLAVEAVMAGRRVTGGRWAPRTVGLPWKAGGAAWSRALGCAPEWSSDALIIGFHPGDEHLRPLGADPSMSRILSQHVQNLAPAAPPPDLVERVRREVGFQLENGGPNLATTARLLGRSERSLRRDLKDRGTSFRQLVDAVRLDRARRLLAELPADEVAQRLGYSELSAFRRAWRRWTGSSLP